MKDEKLWKLPDEAAEDMPCRVTGRVEDMWYTLGTKSRRSSCTRRVQGSRLNGGTGGSGGRAL